MEIHKVFQSLAGHPYRWSWQSADFKENIKQEKLIFLIMQPANISDYKAVFKRKLATNFKARILREGKGLAVDSVFNFSKVRGALQLF